MNCVVMVPVENRQIDRLHHRLLHTVNITALDQESWEAAAYEPRRVFVQLKPFNTALPDRIWYRTDLRIRSPWDFWSGISYRNICVARTHLEYDHDAKVVGKLAWLRSFPENHELSYTSLILSYIVLSALILLGYCAIRRFLEADQLKPGMALFMMATVWAYLAIAWTYVQGGAWYAVWFPLLVGVAGVVCVAAWPH